jgi:hypothetical protein
VLRPEFSGRLGILVFFVCVVVFASSLFLSLQLILQKPCRFAFDPH